MPPLMPVFRAVAAALLLLPAIAQAQGLGPLALRSALGHPLHAEVTIVTAGKGDSGGLHGSLESANGYRAVGLEFNPVLHGVRVTLEERDQGPVLVLRSSRPVREPFLELLVALDSASGRVVRRYSVLFETQSR